MEQKNKQDEGFTTALVHCEVGQTIKSECKQAHELYVVQTVACWGSVIHDTVASLQDKYFTDLHWVLVDVCIWDISTLFLYSGCGDAASIFTYSMPTMLIVQIYHASM